MTRTTVAADAARRLFAPRRSVLLAFGLLVGLLAVYYLQLFVGEPLPGVDATLRAINLPVELLARAVGYGAVPDALGLLVFLGYYYLLAVGLAWLGRRLLTLL